MTNGLQQAMYSTTQMSNSYKVGPLVQDRWICDILKCLEKTGVQSD